MRTLPVAAALAALPMVCLPNAARAQTPATAWGYMAGSKNASVNDSATLPGGRQGALTWTDPAGNLWLFGGYGKDSAGNLGYLNDLWEYSIAGNTWTLKSANATLTVPGNGLCNEGVYTSGSYVVGGRQDAATWVDTATGNLWLFGGDGCGSASTSSGSLNDLWMYNTSSGQWTFEGGDQTTGQTGVYGQQFIASTTFSPGARSSAVAWTSADGSFWLFGGQGFDKNGALGPLNDLWKFDPATLEWAWEAGGLTQNQIGIYGTQGQPASSNVPGSRSNAEGTVDANGNLWLFGGNGCDSSCATIGLLNDLWIFNPATLEWTWEGNGQAYNLSGNAGTEYLTAGSNLPGSREFAHLWADAAGNLWLFGGYGYDTTGANSLLNDLWEFDTATMQWTFMGGSPTGAGAQTPVYGTEGTPATTNIPGGRDNFAAWNTLDNNFWLFGGLGYNATLQANLNDLWEAIPPTPTPAFSLAAGTYQGTQSLTITDAIGGAAIYYTTDGSAPAISSNDAYTGTIAVGKSEYVQAIAVATGHSQSLTRQAQYAIQAQTAINWVNPAPITYGTPLSSVQFDATTSIPGAFVYSPGAGTVLQAGTHTLSVTFTPSDPTTAGFQQATATVTVQVNPATPVIAWATPAPIAYGTALGAAQLDATAGLNGSPVAGTFVYAPAAGAVPAAGTQTLSVTFTPTDTTDYTTATGSVTLTVTQDATTIAWAQPAAITYGSPLNAAQLDATAAYNGTAVPGTFVYSPALGAILPVGTQTLTVTFTPTDTTDYATVKAATTLVVNQAAPIVTWPTPAAIAYGSAIGAAQLDATASVPGAFAYTPAAGTLLTAGSHKLSLVFTPTDTLDYTTATASVTLVVNQATPTIAWPTPAPIAYGAPLGSTQLDATASSNGTAIPGTYVYSPTANAVLAAGTHVLTVTFTPTDTADYTSATGSVTLTVTQDAPTIAWTQPAPITYGTPLTPAQLDATAAYAGTAIPGTFVYSPAVGAILPAGTQTLSVTFVPTDTIDYPSVTATTTIVVSQATPILTWQTPAPIASGTALSSAQLDAASSVPGAFVYTPAAGAVPAAGSQTLSVTFTPTDTTDYTNATASVTLTVLASSFTVSGSPTGQTVYAGYSTDFVVTVAPLNGSFNNPVALTVTGLPGGATATFSNPTVTPGAASATSVLTIAVSSSTTMNQRPASPFGSAQRTLAPLMALLLLLPFRKLRKASRKISLLLILAAALGAMLSFSACGSPATNASQWQSEYVLTVTGTSGTSAQSAQLVLTVE